MVTILSVTVCCAGCPTPFCAEMITWCTPTSPANGVPWMVNVPVANPWAFRLLTRRLAGTPLTVKYIPSPCEGFVGGSGLAGITWFETLGNPVVVTTNDPGIPTDMLAVFVPLICGASFTFKVRDWIAVPAVPASSFNVRCTGRRFPARAFR